MFLGCSMSAAVAQTAGGILMRSWISLYCESNIRYTHKLKNQIYWLLEAMN